jgi:hypothetical protein
LSTTLSSGSDGATSSSLTRKRQRTTDDLLDWRRSQVVKLLSQGLTIDQTAEKLQVSPKTVQRDYAYIRRHSDEVLKNYFVDTIPNEVLKNIARLTAVSDSAWTMAVRAKEKGSDRLEVDALRLAKDTAKEIIEFVTNNKCLINSAFEAVDQDDEEQRRQTNNLRVSQEDEMKKEPVF